MKRRLVCLLLFLFNLAIAQAQVPEPRAGDIVFQDFPNRMRALIAGITQSDCTHCGIVVKLPDGTYVLEAYDPVKYTPLADWIRRGTKQAFGLYRFKNPAFVRPTILAAQAYLGKPYDSRFVLGGEELYCSELIYRAAQDGPHIQLVRPQALKELNWQPWEQEIREVRNGDLPLDETLVSPIALMRSGFLFCIYGAGFGRP